MLDKKMVFALLFFLVLVGCGGNSLNKKIQEQDVDTAPPSLIDDENVTPSVVDEENNTHIVTPIQETNTTPPIINDENQTDETIDPQNWIEETTGLMWQDNGDTNTSLKTFADAKTYCENLNIDIYSDWRVPSLEELFTIVDSSKFDTATKENYTHTNSASYWSSSRYTPDSSLLLGINFYDGGDGLSYDFTPHHVRCVRGELSSHPLFVKSQTQTVSDTHNHLIWQDDDAIGEQLIGYDEAIEYCQHLVLSNQSQWRLPTLVELRSIVDRGRVNPAINQAFEKNGNGFFWSSTLYQPDTNNAWSILFTDGNDYWQPKSNRGYVRCVKEN